MICTAVINIMCLFQPLLQSVYINTVIYYTKSITLKQNYKAYRSDNF